MVKKNIKNEKKIVSTELPIYLTAIGIFLAFAYIIYAGGGFNPDSVDNQFENAFGAQLTTMTSSGNAATVSGTWRAYLVTGGSANDSLNIMASHGKLAENIRALDCSNGTGKNCILIFDK